MDKLHDIKGIAFDLDGTLVDSAPGLTDAIDNALYALELPSAGEERVVTWIGNGADVLVERALTWALKDKTPTPEQQRMMRKLFDSYYASFAEEGSFLFPDVAATLQALHDKGIPMAVVTNKPSPFVAPILTALGIGDYFQVIIGGDDVRAKKPHPAPLYLVLGKFGLYPHELLFVGDSRNDIQAAQAAGAHSVGLTYGYNYGEAIALSKPDLVFDRFSDLLPVLGLPHNDNQEMKNE